MSITGCHHGFIKSIFLDSKHNDGIWREIVLEVKHSREKKVCFNLFGGSGGVSAVGLTTEGVFECFHVLEILITFLFFFSSFLFFFLEVLGGGRWVSLIMGPSSTFHFYYFYH